MIFITRDTHGYITSEANLQRIYDIVKYKKWYFGHWHLDENLYDNFYCLYQEYKII